MSAAAALALVFAIGANAHDIPTDLRINVFAKPAGNRLELLIRVPMAALADTDYPMHGNGFLTVSKADEALRDAAKVWLVDNIDVLEEGTPVASPEIAAARVSLPSDRSFVTYDLARRHLRSPSLADDLDLYWNQQLLDVLLVYPIASERSRFSLRLRFDRLAHSVTTALRFLTPSGAIRPFELHGDAGLVHLDPSWAQAAGAFVVEGFWHILSGTDHLLFLACLVIPFRRLRPLAAIVTAFTVAHSISLAASTFGFVPDGLWFPPLVETLIAVTILYMALENIVGSRVGRRWMMAFAFGLVHGFGFSFGLAEAFQFAGDHLATALFGFNLGVELGQLAVLIVLVPALELLFRQVVPERIGIIILSALVAHTAWHWMLDRGSELAKFPLPTLDAQFLLGAIRGLLALLVLAGVVALANRLVRPWLAPAPRHVEVDDG